MSNKEEVILELLGNLISNVKIQESGRYMDVKYRNGKNICFFTVGDLNFKELDIVSIVNRIQDTVYAQ